ncbi:MAG: triose-phosphate isomerase [Planctomycetes bacterium]|nr:triose-phosphate isomerase [Planctomycetota bacterium]
MSARKPFVAGNWKMNLERKTALGLALAVRDAVGRREDVDVAVFPPFVYLDEVARALAGSRVRCGAQNCSDEPSGAFTGEIAPAMLVDVGATHVIVGHSERRHLYGEGSELVGRKVQLALEHGLSPILCVGETLEERDARRTESVVGEQLARGLAGVDGRALQTRVTLAYEPVWAIGTGRTATPAQAGEVHAYLRGVLAGLYNEPAAENTRILYGGSVKPDNVRALMAVRGVDGVLVGGASLKPETFLPLLEFR